MAPNGLALSPGGSIQYVVESNSTTGQALARYSANARKVWAFQVSGSILINPNLTYQTESDWPDGLRVSETGIYHDSNFGRS